MKILFEFNGKQRLVDVEPTGFVAAEATVLWNEKVDGRFPDNLLESVGGLDRSGNQLVVNAQKLADHQAAISAVATANSARATRVSQAKAFLNGLDFSSNLSATQMTQSIRAICVLYKDLERKL